MPDPDRPPTFLGTPRNRKWIRRAAIALIPGIVIAILFGWRAGLPVVIVLALADAWYVANTASSVRAWRKLGASERKTERQLAAMAGGGYRALHARAIPDSDAQIDHLVIGPTGVYAVDSENWDKLPLRAMSHRKLFLGPYNKKDRLDEARWEATKAGELIGARLDIEMQVRPSLAVYGPAVPWNVLTIRDVDVYTGKHLKKYLKKRPKTLTRDEIDRIYRVAVQLLPQRYGDDVEAPN